MCDANGQVNLLNRYQKIYDTSWAGSGISNRDHEDSGISRAGPARDCSDRSRDFGPLHHPDRTWDEEVSVAQAPAFRGGARSSRGRPSLAAPASNYAWSLTVSRMLLLGNLVQKCIPAARIWFLIQIIDMQPNRAGQMGCIPEMNRPPGDLIRGHRIWTLKMVLHSTAVHHFDEKRDVNRFCGRLDRLDRPPPVRHRGLKRRRGREGIHCMFAFSFSACNFSTLIKNLHYAAGSWFQDNLKKVQLAPHREVQAQGVEQCQPVLYGAARKLFRNPNFAQYFKDRFVSG
ncbi:hypothetical protein BDP27DRAFT_1365183 [Rhodocollybia butyracea]|uniref:Uncharacterized protein n=1 Tax=Rhodocollybia butyracea TaxID=206335 RepID=A0A9P5PR76_9AGAR|nr:hypothetical protein BDP27DRAFT_1365183 [Rhodocollybia butyracea]